jgi:outer membrane protein assembly factor BamD (BamD/ComL family)
MQLLIRTSFIFVLALFLLPEPGSATIVFRPGQKAKFVPPGEEEISGDASQLYQIGQTAEKEGNPKRAIRAYKTIVKRHPKDALAPTAIHISSWLKDMRAARILMMRSKGNSASAKFICMARN